MSSSTAAPPKLHFDDGSRIMAEATLPPTNPDDTTTQTEAPSPLVNPRPQNVVIDTYYEIERVARDIVTILFEPSEQNESSPTTDGFLCRVALQFPNQLLADSPEVCWRLQVAIPEHYERRYQSQPVSSREMPSPSCPPLVFVLGDTNHATGPDEVGAMHLNANVIVHYGPCAFIHPTESLPVVYSFGVHEWALEGMKDCCNSIQELQQQRIQEEGEEKRDGDPVQFLILYELSYQSSMERFVKVLEETCGAREVVLGQVPTLEETALMVKRRQKAVQSSSCCGEDNQCTKPLPAASLPQHAGCCDADERIGTNDKGTSSDESSSNDLISIAGLKVHLDPASFSDYILLYIGDNSGNSKSHQFLNTLLKCTSPHSSTKQCWSYDPPTRTFHSDPASILGVSRFINRRFYLTQRAQMATRIGILVGTLSQNRFRTVVSTLRRKIEESGRACYTFAVGKINVAKLANFAEVECFVLVSCGESSILQDERDFHVPVITPMELDIALGEQTWNGSASCSTDFDDFLANQELGIEEVESLLRKNLSVKETLGDERVENSKDLDDISCNSSSEDDEPYFSMISGTYVSKPKSKKRIEKDRQRQKEIGGIEVDLTNQPGNGQLTQYKSEAAKFWKQREYKGLEANVGKDEAKAATMGQTGIASDYGK